MNTTFWYLELSGITNHASWRDIHVIEHATCRNVARLCSRWPNPSGAMGFGCSLRRGPCTTTTPKQLIGGERWFYGVVGWALFCCSTFSPPLLLLAAHRSSPLAWQRKRKQKKHMCGLHGLWRDCSTTTSPKPSVGGQWWFLALDGALFHVYLFVYV